MAKSKSSNKNSSLGFLASGMFGGNVIVLPPSWSTDGSVDPSLFDYVLLDNFLRNLLSALRDRDEKTMQKILTNQAEILTRIDKLDARVDKLEAGVADVNENAGAVREKLDERDELIRNCEFYSRESAEKLGCFVGEDDELNL